MRTTLAFLGTCAFVLWVSIDAVAALTEETFTQKCAGCHGKDGKAQTAMGRRLNIKDLSDPKVQAASTDADWEKVILNGKSAEGRMVMPGYKGQLTPEQIKTLIKVCRDFKGK